ncbi:histidine phosphatase family protein [Aquicoccus sp. G2-2]|uniref:histidine phosphatase family protein n=1 Tax=Aquicoccus sp. G2-2 TaxID=3092120 RepID=UPI002ADF98FF|nr:histidine phosphatase family protein [Aquicoccus sp. G2-2]MEA1112423.1 histidine phosphatase family protein [Aquicoccus sp. G2-2]
MQRIFWVRHGPTHAKTLVGWSDLPADLGDTAAIARLSAALPQDAAVVSSDLCRATATADALQGTRTRLPHDPALREMHFGDWELKSREELTAQAQYRTFWDHPGDVRPPGGESWHELGTRVDTAVARLMAAQPKRDLVIVAHFGVILSQLQQALKLDTAAAFAHRLDNLSLTELHHSPSGWHAARFNHLP